MTKNVSTLQRLTFQAALSGFKFLFGWLGEAAGTCGAELRLQTAHRDSAVRVSHYYFQLLFNQHAAGFSRTRLVLYGKPGPLGCVLMRHLCRDEENTHRAAHEMSALPPRGNSLK